MPNPLERKEGGDELQYGGGVPDSKLEPKHEDENNPEQGDNRKKFEEYGKHILIFCPLPEDSMEKPRLEGRNYYDKFIGSFLKYKMSFENPRSNNTDLYDFAGNDYLNYLTHTEPSGIPKDFKDTSLYFYFLGSLITESEYNEYNDQVVGCGHWDDSSFTNVDGMYAREPVYPDDRIVLLNKTRKGLAV